MRRTRWTSALRLWGDPVAGKRVFAHYSEWEDAREGMWRSVPGVERARYRMLAARLMIDVEAFTRVSRLVLRDWPKASAVNLSTHSINQQAWLGHAACCMATRSPEDVTREAWRTLTSGQQAAANAAVDVVIDEWERANGRQD
jgi:hypothetical protein